MSDGVTGSDGGGGRLIRVGAVDMMGWLGQTRRYATAQSGGLLAGRSDQSSRWLVDEETDGQSVFTVAAAG